MLHAWRLEFPSVIAGNVTAGNAAGCTLPARIEAPLPQAFRETIEKIFGNEKSILNRLFPL
jgi:hypothetical protein